MGLGSITIEFQPSGKVVQTEPGTPLRQAAQIAGADLDTPCGGKGRCGKCAVVFLQGAPPPTPTELDRLTDTELIQGCRLACQTTVYEHAVVCVPDSSQAASILTAGTARQTALRPAITKKHARIPKPTVDDLRSDLTRVLEAFDIAPSQAGLDVAALRRLASDLRRADFGVTGVFAGGRPIDFEPGDTTGECFGAAVDIGTTTLAAYLLDLNSGRQLSVAASMNPQARIGEDVVSRISYVMERPGGLEELRASIVGELNRLLGDLADGAGISPQRIYEVSVVGNTCMMHLLLGIDPRHLAVAPYVPVVSRSLYMRARELGIGINDFGYVHVLPSIAGYVGADTVGVILATALYEYERPALAVDIGTNGEIVLGCKGRILACSTAAGPAFEGAHIRHGMRAAPGAIDAVWFDNGAIRFSTVGGAKAAGICGSGLLDAVVCLVQAGIVEPGGRIVDAGEIPKEFAHLSENLHGGDRGNEFVLAAAEESCTGGPIVITQRDVREVQLAKGAIAAGIQTLMERLNVRADDLDRVVLAGAFGNYVRKESAIAAGMIPDVPLSKVHLVGNAAGEGAKLALISLDMRGDAECIAESTEYVELTTETGFQERFADALMLGNWSRT
ncbi:MAG TPA: ASKHA domain-containing protein [Armatimonadota bacterium]|nr:ASKHA domain-containing protein [Armatimonadota bacterium]